MSSLSVDDDLFDTVAADFLARFRSGEHPSIEDYIQRHPEISAEIRELFPTMLAIERMKLRKEHSSDGRASLGARRLERLGDFRIVKEIGRGGMGIVFEAEQESLERHVALKVLPPNSLQDDSHVRRFHREAQTAARLHHTNIVPVFGVGEDDGLHYYVMQLIDGEPLDRCLQGGPREPLPPNRAAELIRHIADAVQFAHEQGTLHRDIKPANLLLDQQGHVWITDFGLAQVLERDETVTDHVAGTLRYMAPERFQGIADARTDQYSLGITLYELVTGQRAFEGSSTGELMHRITHGEPASLRSAAARIPRDLQTVIEKAISREPGHRYPSVGEFGADLQRFLESRPIQARPVSGPERLWRWCRRNRALSAALASTAVLLMLVAVMLSVGYYRSARNATRLQGILAEREAALQSESNALRNEKLAREQERTAREQSDAITKLALEGLDRVFDEFAPATPYTTALAVTSSSDTDDPLLLPAQATVTPQVATVLERLLPLYQQLSEQTARDTQVRLRSASAEFRLGLIYRQLGRQDSARTAFWVARSELESLAEEQALPPPDLRLQLARVLNELGDLDRQTYQPSRERRAAHQQSLDLLTSIPSHELSREEQLELARTHYYLGRRDFFLGPPPGNGPGRGDRGRGPREPDDNRTPRVGLEPADRPGERDGQPPDLEAIRRSESFAPSEPGRDQEPGERRDRGGPPRGGFRFPDREQTGRHLQQAIELLESLPDFAHDTRAQLLLARCYRERSNQHGFEEHEARQADWDKAVDVLMKLVEDAPSTPDFRFELSETYADIEPRFLPADRYTEAEPRLREALRLSEQLVTDAPDVPAYAAGQTQALIKLAYILKQTERTDEAQQRYEQAVTIQTRLATEHPENSTHVIWIARVKRYLAMLLVNRQQFDEAAELLLDAGAAIEPLLHSPNQTDGPAGFFASATLGETYGTLADILRDQGRGEEAAQYQSKADTLGPGRFFRSRRPPQDRPRP